MNFAEAGLADYIDIKEGTAKSILADLRSISLYKNYFNFVFIDADKHNVIDYFKQVIYLVKIGGLIAADNLYDPPYFIDTMSRYSKYIRTRSDVQTTSVRIGKGQELTLRLE